MKNAAPILLPFYRVEKTFKEASDHAFRFAMLKRKFKSQNKSRKRRKIDIGGKVSPTWVFLSFLGIIAAFGCGIYEANNAQSTIAALVDPEAKGVISPTILMIIGISISIIGMMFGHLIYEGFSDGFKVDPYTGAKRPTSKLWLSLAGFICACFYIGYQYALVKSAGSSVGVGNESSLNYLTYVVVGVAIFELLIGIFILHNSFSYFMFFGICLLLLWTNKNMNKAAKSTNESYRNYLSLLNSYNHENPNHTKESEGNMNVRAAIAFYSGINLAENEQTSVEESPNSQSDTVPQPELPLPQDRNATRENVSRPEENPQIASFLDDTTDDNLTV